MITNPKGDYYITPTWSADSASAYVFKHKLGKEGITVSVDVDIDYKDQVSAGWALLPSLSGLLYNSTVFPVHWVDILSSTQAICGSDDPFNSRNVELTS